MKKSTWILLGVLAVLLIWAWTGYNGLVKLDEQSKQYWANVQSAYQRRADLIPNLVNTVKGAANFEKGTLQSVIEARAKATSIQVDPNKLTADNMRKFQAAQGALSQALGRLMVLTENYPQLRATEAFQGLQTQIEGTENRIKVSRDDFNRSVQRYNTKVRGFPTLILAKLIGFTLKTPFQADAEAQKAPVVAF